jgi:hypothetical protein
MIASMLSRARHLLSHSVLGSNLAGDGLLVRLRSTSIGLLGVVTAVGLGLIAFIAQLGWPGVFNAPIPGAQHQAGAVHDAIALTQPAPQFASLHPSRGSHGRIGASSQARHRHLHLSEPRGSKVAPGIGGSRQLGAAGNVQAHQPTAQSPASTPAPLADEPSPKFSSSGDSKGDSPAKAKSHGTASIDPKDKSDWSGKSDAPSTAKPKDYPGPEVKSDAKASPAAAKPTEYSPGKPVEEKDAASPEATVFPAVTPLPKDLPESGSGDDKDAGYAGKSDKRHH